MPEIQKISVALTSEQLTALKTAVDTGEYATTSEIVREAIRDWQLKRQLRHEDIVRLRQMWDEGKASGPGRVLDPASVKQRGRMKAAAARPTRPHAR